jgi:cytoskeletal protein CcmA (bactofilin family)
MFNKQSKSLPGELAGGSTTIIGAGTTIKGDLESNGDIRIDGTLIGNITAKEKIIIGPEGTLIGDLHGNQADILGKISGKIKIDDLLQIRGKANIQGDIYASKLQLEPSATFNGQCFMGANIVDLNAEVTNTSSAAAGQ